jgi:hypothetical protein
VWVREQAGGHRDRAVARRIAGAEAGRPGRCGSYIIDRGGAIRLSNTIAILAATAGAAAAAAPAAAADDVVICNEAENSHRGGYEVSGGVVDPNPPAFLRGSQMDVGEGAGLLNAAQHSPALRECQPADGDGGGPVST